MLLIVNFRQESVRALPLQRMWGEDNLTIDFENALNYYHNDASRNLRCAAMMIKLFSND